MENRLTNFAASLTTQWDGEADDKLIACMADGASEKGRLAFDVFYRRHAEYLYGICYNLVNRYKFGFFSEEDVFQTTMLKARDNAHTFKSNGIKNPQELEDAVDAWLGGIAKHAVFDLFRRIPRCVCLDPQLLDGEDDVDMAFIQANESTEENQKEEIKLMREAIDALSPKEREVIWAISQFYVRRAHQRTPAEDLDEIVQGLGISRDNFRKIKQRARAKILKYITNHKTVTEAK